MSEAMQTTTVEETKPQGMFSRLVRAILITVAAFWAISHLSQGFTLITGRFLWTDGNVEPGLPLEHLPILTTAELRPGTSATMEDADLLLRWANAMPLFLEAATVVIAAWLLLRVLRRVTQREAFSTNTINYWKALALTLMVGGVLIGLINTFATLYTSTHVGLWPSTGQRDRDAQADFLGGDYVGINIDFPYWPISLIVAGLVALALTTAFRAGAQLERDVDGVI